MTIDEVKTLMQTSTTPEEWKTNTLKVKAAFGGNYPRSWYAEIIMSGLAESIVNKFGETMKMKIQTFDGQKWNDL